MRLLGELRLVDLGQLEEVGRRIGAGDVGGVPGVLGVGCVTGYCGTVAPCCADKMRYLRCERSSLPQAIVQLSTVSSVPVRAFWPMCRHMPCDTSPNAPGSCTHWNPAA